MSRSAVEAVLNAGDTETLYRRAGDGPHVLILCAARTPDEPLGGRMFDRLATEFRVIAAAAPAGANGTELGAWIDELIEGLGLDRPAVILDPALAGMLLAR
jgi:hypothetical protein